MTQHLTLLEFANDFLVDRQTIGKAKTTIKYYKQELFQFEKWLELNQLDKQAITDFTPSQFRDYFISLSTHRGKSGVHSSYRTIRALFNWVWDQEDLTIRNPISKIKVEPSKIPPLPEIPTSNIQKMLEKCSTRRYKLRDRAIIKLLFDSGLRSSELCNLNVADINLTTGQVTVWHGKGNKFGISFVGANTLKTIIEYLDSRNNPLPDSPLFPNQENNRMTYSALRDLLTTLAKKSDVPYQGVHSFRRAFALSIWRKTHDLLTVSRLLRHSNLQVTTRYLNINNEDLQQIHNQNSPADLLI